MFASRVRVKLSDENKPDNCISDQATMSYVSWDTLCVRLKHPDNIAVICILVFWFFVLDIGVIMVDKSDIHATEYLTNQTWFLCLLAKVLLAIELCKHTDRTGNSECTTFRGW